MRAECKRRLSDEGAAQLSKRKQCGTLAETMPRRTASCDQAALMASFREIRTSLTASLDSSVFCGKMALPCTRCIISPCAPSAGRPHAQQYRRWPRLPACVLSCCQAGRWVMQGCTGESRQHSSTIHGCVNVAYRRISHPYGINASHLKAFKGPADLQDVCHGFCAVWGVEGAARHEAGQEGRLVTILYGPKQCVQGGKLCKSPG